MMRAAARLMRFSRDRRGVSAVEFALVAPMMIALYFGCVEISDGVAADRKVSLTAAALANLVAQSTSLSSTDMNNVLDASTAIIAPYSASNLKMTVSCLSIDANKNVTTKWTATRNGGTGMTLTVPTDLKVASTQLIFAQVSYAYKPIVGYTITGTLTLSDQMFMMPRITAPTYGTTSCT
ncbi:MAG TPA: TadE/TadG family type IV pilus assembly protein [Pseudolabrys sp.]|jgi:Flp pilus assembly protein TadG